MRFSHILKIWRHFQAKIERSSLPIYSTYVFVGRSPYVGFGWHTPNAPQNVLSDALYALGSQVYKSLIFPRKKEDG